MKAWFIAIAIVFLIQETAACLSGWSRHGNSCYRLYRTKRSWTEATLACMDHKGHLAIISSAEENEFIVDKLKDSIGTENRVWLGASDDENEGFWAWQGSDVPISGYTNWYPSQPDSGKGNHDEDCMCLDPRLHYQWHDTRCGEDHYYICEVSTEYVIVG